MRRLHVACTLLGVALALGIHHGCSRSSTPEPPRKSQRARTPETSGEVPDSYEMPYETGGAGGGGPTGYLETVISQPRNVTLTLVKRKWEQAVEAFNSFNSRYPESLDEIRNDENARTFVPDESKVPQGFSFKYTPHNHQVVIMKRVQLGGSAPDNP